MASEPSEPSELGEPSEPRETGPVASGIRLAEPEPPGRSLDTEWFAVDDLGHIAVFDAGSRGLVPDPAVRDWPVGSSLAFELIPLLADAGPEVLSYEAADLFAGGRAGPLASLLGLELLDAPPSYDQTLHGVLVQLQSRPGTSEPRPGARDRFAAAGLVLLPSREGGYAWGNPESPHLRDLWREGWVRSAALGHVIEWSRFGMFRYEHLGTAWAATAEDIYMQVAAPRVPIRVQALPTSLRARIGARLPGVDFRVAHTVHVSATVGPEA